MTAEAHSETPGTRAVSEIIAALKKAVADAEVSRMRMACHEELHQLVDQLEPDQAELVRTVALHLVTSGRRDPADPPRRQFPFAGSISAEPDLAERSEEILDEIVRRNAG